MIFQKSFLKNYKPKTPQFVRFAYFIPDYCTNLKQYSLKCITDLEKKRGGVEWCQVNFKHKKRSQA